MNQRKMNSQKRVFNFRLISVFAMLFILLAGCSGGGTNPDGDTEEDTSCECQTNDDCNECYYCSNCACLYELGCVVDGDKDGDLDNTTDGDTSDNPEDGDNDYCEVDCTTDGDSESNYREEEEEGCVTDEDCPDNYRCHLGICYYFEDGDDDMDGDIDIIDEEICQCVPGSDHLCGDNEYCGDDCMCHPLEEGSQCSDEQFGECSAHTDCPVGIPCDLETGCCDLATVLDCSIEGCPDGMYCESGFCQVDCVPDILECEASDECCSTDGRCGKWVCLLGDEDSEEDDWSGCTNCDDCLNAPQFGEDYYCSIITHDCELKPYSESEDVCCKNADCVLEDNGMCDLRLGLCYYVADPIDRGSISGSVYVSELLYNQNQLYTVVLENSTFVEIRRDSNRTVENVDGGYKFDYTFDTLKEGSYYVYVLDQTSQEYPNAFNPIQIIFDDIEIEKTIREDIDFYFQVEDPRLGKIEGTITMDTTPVSTFVEVELFKRQGGTYTLTQYANANTGGTTSRDYMITGLVDGNYIAVATYDDTVVDYYSKLISINLAANPNQLVSNIDFYFDGAMGDYMGNITGQVHYDDNYLSQGDISVKLYDPGENMVYPRDVAKTSNFNSSTLDYGFHNVESGSYDIVCEVEYNDFTYLAYPLPEQNASIDIPLNTSIDAQDIDIYIDSINPDYCSISGTMIYNDLFDTGDFNIEVYDSDAYSNLVVSDPVLFVNGDNAEFFIENLEPGTYYLKAVKADNAAIFKTYGSGITVMLSGGTKDQDNIIIDFTN